MYSLLFTICRTRVIHGAKWWEREGWSPLQQWQLLLTLELCCRTIGDLTPTLAGIQMYGNCTVTAGQLLPFSWNRRCARSPFDLTPLCPCIKSKSITGTEWALGRMIVLTGYGCINLLALFFPPAGVVVSHCSKDRAATFHNCEEIKPNYVSVQFGGTTWQTRMKCCKSIFTIMAWLD